MKNFKDKVFAITGCGSGIGQQLALQLAAKGAKLAINDYNENGLNSTIDLLNKQNATFISTLFDVSKKQNWIDWHAEILKEFEEIDGLINNAGVALDKIALCDVKEADLKWIMDINVWGLMHGSRVFLPSLIKSKEASLVNISSIFGVAGIAEQVPYCTTKFAVRGFTEALRMELQPTHPNVCVQVVHPGGIGTNIVRNGRTNSNEQFKETIREFDDKLVRMTAEKCASIIIKGIEKKKQKILVGNDAWLLDKLVRNFPVSYSRFLNWGKKKRGIS